MRTWALLPSGHTKMGQEALSRPAHTSGCEQRPVELVQEQETEEAQTVEFMSAQERCNSSLHAEFGQGGRSGGTAAGQAAVAAAAAGSGARRQRSTWVQARGLLSLT